MVGARSRLRCVFVLLAFSGASKPSTFPVDSAAPSITGIVGNSPTGSLSTTMDSSRCDGDAGTLKSHSDVADVANSDISVSWGASAENNAGEFNCELVLIFKCVLEGRVGFPSCSGDEVRCRSRNIVSLDSKFVSDPRGEPSPREAKSRSDASALY